MTFQDINEELRAARLQALMSYRLMDTPPEPQFDGIVQLASRICETPVSLVSLVETDRQWFKARVGFDACETPIGQSVCAIALNEDEILIIPDLAADARTRGNTLVTEAPHIRFYAGAVLRDREGYALGALCVIDDKPRPGGLTPEQADSLILLARQTMALIEMRQAVGRRDGVLVEQQRAANDVASRLEAAQTRLRSAQSAAMIGAFEVDIPAGRLYGTDVFAEVYGLAPAPSYDAAETLEVILPEDRALASNMTSLASGDVGNSARYRIRRPRDGAIRWIFRRGAFEYDAAGNPLRYIGVLEDITDRRLAEERVGALLSLGDQLREAETRATAITAAMRLLGETLGAARTGYATVDGAAQLFSIEGGWSASPDDADRSGRYPFSLFEQTIARLDAGETVVIDDVEAATWLGGDRDTYLRIETRALVVVPLARRGAVEGAVFVHAHDEQAWTPDEISFVAAVADRTYAAIARLQAEADQQVLNLELSHRMKNTIAVVQSIAQQTLKRSADPEALRDFDHRVAALGRAHEVLLQRNWVAARITTVVEAAAGPDGWGERIDLAGPELALNAKSALNLALLLHELLTNAVKHGALSTPAGRVRLEWAVVGQGANAALRLSWTERDGPPVVAPTRRGFGSRLIQAGLGGPNPPDLAYPPTGFTATFTAPLSQIVEI